MRVTSVRVNPTPGMNDRFVAYADIILDDSLIIKGAKIVRCPRGLIVQMPSRKDGQGKARDVVHPITTPLRVHIETAVLEAYARLCPAVESVAV